MGGYFKPESWGAEPKDLAKEFKDYEAESIKADDRAMKSRETESALKAEFDQKVITGQKTSKGLKISSFVPTDRFKQNHERIFGH